jgi:3-oxoacyl-[acyl-carrier protein] reductase
MSDHLGKVVLVTGGGRGIGRGIALAFAKNGANVAVADADASSASTVAREIESSGGQASSYGLDIVDETVTTLRVDEIAARYGCIDILVHCAAVNRLMPFLQTPVGEWRRIIDVNLTGSFIVAQAVARRMVERRSGRIILIASNVGFRGAIDRAAYAASKAGVINLMQTMAIELAEHSITVNAIAPGPTDTPMTAWQPASVRKALCADLPMNRYGKIEEIAAGALFLASDEASFVTAHTLAIDGGFTGAGVIHRSAE